MNQELKNPHDITATISGSKLTVCSCSHAEFPECVSLIFLNLTETEQHINCQYLSAKTARQIPVHLLDFQFSDLESVVLK